ncbi:hypothetical protein DdX_22265 [Ditylenchus destructor]|uniref:Uncharacterized protein n=1 Tax=Ditylenchus destructor TaxID=166010 RepID=A0AAD4MEL3_9BILA|nr:hypothetical protein DdX_22265 [Ditylenchus destructor]
MLNDIINHDFGTRPIRLISDIGIRVLLKEEGLVISICKDHSCFVINTREWIDHPHMMECEHFAPINEMRPFLCKNVRFGYANITTSKPFSTVAPYKLEYIATLESISHVWTAKHLGIYDNSSNDMSCLKMMLESPSLFQCRILRISDRKKRFEILNQPILYTLYGIVFGKMFDHFDMCALFKQKTSFPNSDTIFAFEILMANIDSALETIKQEYLSSKECCRLRFIISVYSPNLILDFCLMNTHTNEVLELKHISKNQANEFNLGRFGSPALLLERRGA